MKNEKIFDYFEEILTSQWTPSSIVTNSKKTYKKVTAYS